eukprot:scaffold69141_cov36-Phaeocystis_antarctica.AAC.1
MTWVGARPQHGPQDSTGAGYLARLKILRDLGVGILLKEVHVRKVERQRPAVPALQRSARSLVVGEGASGGHLALTACTR